MIRLRAFAFLFGWCLLLLLPPRTYAGGCLYPTAGYMLSLGGNEGDVESAPFFGARLEYNASREHVLAVGVVYQYSHHDIPDLPTSESMDQHLCLLSYRIGRNWTWVNVGTHLGMGAAIRDYSSKSHQASGVVYATQVGFTLSFRPLPYLYVGPDATFTMTTDVDKWIFGGRSSYFFNLGGHVALDF